ncbi:MAG: phenylacetate-CoA oxygenase subunit PaaI, partial [Parvularculaceae bacterium]|nr:phenylacetate-CoA oxygenase subunit PaaI [Parvularculaceae bacterium]
TASSDERVAAIAEKSAKEAAYHLERSEDLVVRLGDGSVESRQIMQRALDVLWPFAGELTYADDLDDALAARGLAPELSDIKNLYDDYMARILPEATLTADNDAPIRKGGKAGLHSEEMGRILPELQFLQRAYRGAAW